MTPYDGSMAWVILILVLAAAAFGVLGAVIKAVAFLVLTILLTVAALAAIAWYGFRHQIRRWERGGLRTRSGQRTTDEAPRGLPTRDDRY
jgi:peptidoglycan/LPS O-acetylase OafA/YrhL